MGTLSQWFSGIDLGQILDWLMVAAASILAICVHESCHGLAALWLGDDTAKRMHRISLNPLRHIDVVGLIMMIVVRFGWAKPVPVNMYRFKNPKLGMALTALAGPVSNVLLALLGMIGYNVFLYYTISSYSELLYDLTKLFYYIALINAGLAVFNLIPISPLDGSKVLAIFLPKQAHAWLMRYERYGFILLIVLLFSGVFSGVLVTLRDGLIDGLDAIAVPVSGLFTGL